MANSILIKPNQVGTVSETLAATRVAAPRLTRVVSARSGETEDSTIADFAVGIGAGANQDWIDCPRRAVGQIQSPAADRRVARAAVNYAQLAEAREFVASVARTQCSEDEDR